jgi:hypothetical protein
MISEIYRILLRAVGSDIQYHVQEDGPVVSYLGVLVKTLARRPLILTGFPWFSGVPRRKYWNISDKSTTSFVYLFSNLLINPRILGRRMAKHIDSTSE